LNLSAICHRKRGNEIKLALDIIECQFCVVKIHFLGIRVYIFDVQYMLSSLGSTKLRTCQ
jgi:hypothetical protein